MNTKKKILITDDNPLNIDMLSKILKNNYDVRIAPNGKKALELVRKESPDLLLLDIEMPEISGYDVCKELKNDEATRDIPIIFVTAKDEEGDEEIGFELGAVDYIKKPFKPTTIKSRVSTHIKLKEQERELKNFNKILVDQVELEVAARLNLEKERKVQDAILLQQSKLAEMGEMIGAIAHQWKQPINTSHVILMLLEDEIAEESINKEDAIEYIQNLKDQIMHMNQTIDDFRKFLLPTKEKKIFAPCESVDEILKMLKHQFIKYKVDVEVHPHEKFMIEGFPNEFKQVMMNLFKNASDVFEERDIKDRKIDIHVDNMGEKCSVKIIDNGGGIPEELLPTKLFEPYISTKGDKGTGIGLQLVKKIITEHFGGEVKAYNVENGACFELTLPTIKQST